MNKNYSGGIKIKTKLLIGLLVISLLVSIFSVNADTPLASGDVTIVEDSIDLSISYSDFKDDDEDIIEQNTDPFIIKNNNLEEVKIKIEATSLPSGYSTESKEMIIAGSGEVQTTLKIYVPHKEDAGTENIGSIVLKGESDSLLDNVILNQETKSMLELSNLKVEYTNKDHKLKSDSFNGDDESFSLDEDVLFYKPIKLTFKLKNLLESDYRIDIESIKLTLRSEDDDLFNSDFEEEYDLEDLGGEEKSEFEVELMIDEDADSGSNTIEITLEGEDENGAEYKIEKELSLEVSKVNDDLRITKLELNPEKLTACDEKLQLTLGVRNFGSNKQKYAAISIYNEELAIDEHVDQIEIEDHNDNPDYWEKEFTFNLNDKLKIGEYDLDINVYVDKDEQVDFKRVSLPIEKCKVEVKETPVEQKEENKTEVITSTLDINENVNDEEELVDDENVKTTSNNNEENTALTSSTIIDTIEDSYSQEDFLVGIILVAIVMMLIIIIMFFVVLLK